MAWISPTGHYDPDSVWVQPERAYDDKITYYANCGYNELKYLELTHDVLNCDKVRIYASDAKTGTEYDPDLQVDVHYGGAWHNIQNGVIAKKTWVEIAIGSTQSVDKARVCSNGTARVLWLYEFDFNEVEAPPPKKRTLVQMVNI